MDHAKIILIITLCFSLFTGYATTADESSLVINTTPEGASLLFNETLSGTTPATIIGLSAGTYPFLLTIPGYEDYQTEIEILDDTRYAVYIALNQSESASDTGTEPDSDTVDYSSDTVTQVSSSEIIYSGYAYPVIYPGYIYEDNGPTVIIVNPDPITPTPTPTSSGTGSGTETETESGTGSATETETGSGSGTPSSSEEETSSSTESESGDGEEDTESSAGSEYDGGDDEETDTDSGVSSSSGRPLSDSFTGARAQSGIEDKEDEDAEKTAFPRYGRITTPIPTRPQLRESATPIRPDTTKPHIIEENPIPTVIPTIVVPKDFTGQKPSALQNQNKDPGMIEVRSNIPGAEVYIDGVKRGTAPITIRDLSAGNHQIQVGQAGYQQFLTDVMINPGSQIKKPQMMQVNLKPQFKR
ncbi:MAG: PEGA domain-containing protein [Methanospirillaceae archaeon]|nr:PEGA domain-containing protein [Methanospirillaceae archaeon]